MASRRPEVVPAQIRRAHERFGRWRARKRGREPIPDILWRAAAKLCKTHGVHRVARWLRLNYTALRDRSQGTGSASSRRAPAFVEWAPAAMPSVAAPAVEYLLEVERSGERTLRVRVRGAAVAEVATLACALRQDSQQA